MWDQATLVEHFRQILLDSKPIAIAFSPNTPANVRVDTLVSLDLLYKSIGGGELVIDAVSLNDLCVILKPHDSPDRNLVY